MEGINKELVRAVCQIAVDAGHVILDIYHNASDVEIQSKADDSPITKADRAANEVICEGLKNLSISFPIISEENKEVPYEERKDFEYFWVVDPLDGTKEFIKRNGEFTVNIGLIAGDQPILGVVYVPAQEKLYWGLKDQGSFVVENGEETLLKVSDFDMNDAALNVVSSRSHLNDETKAYVAKLNEPNFVPTGSSLKFMLVAEGKAHLYPRFIPCMEWDTAAAQIIVEEAGGSVINIETKASLRYNKEVLLNPYFISFGNVTGDTMIE